MHFSALSAYHKQPVDSAKTKENQIQKSSTDKKLSIITLMEEVKPRVMKK